MQVILLEKVANLGNLGDVVKVKDGFARNFLIPDQGCAPRHRSRHQREFEARRADSRRRPPRSSPAPRALAEKMNGRTVHITQKAGVDGRLFGSVTNPISPTRWNRIGFEVVKAQVRMPNGPLNRRRAHRDRCRTPTSSCGNQGCGDRRNRLIKPRDPHKGRHCRPFFMVDLSKSTGCPDVSPAARIPPGARQVCPQSCPVFRPEPTPAVRDDEVARLRVPPPLDRGRAERARRPAARQQRLGPCRRPAHRQRLLPLGAPPDLCGPSARW